MSGSPGFFLEAFSPSGSWSRAAIVSRGSELPAREFKHLNQPRAQLGFHGAEIGAERHTSYNCDETWQQESWDVLSRKQSRPILLVGRHAR